MTNVQEKTSTAPLSSEVVQARVEELLAAMTPAEKAGQLTQYFYFGFEPTADSGLVDDSEEELGQAGMVEEALRRGEVGSLLFVTDPAEINRLQRLAVEGNRLGIPALFGFDVIHGLRTILPVPIGMAASWGLATIEAGQWRRYWDEESTPLFPFGHGLSYADVS